jgi:hypothetical protein
MLRFVVAFIAACLSGAAPALAQSAPAPVRPVATSEVGPWEVVVWRGDARHTVHARACRTGRE